MTINIKTKTCGEVCYLIRLFLLVFTFTIPIPYFTLAQSQEIHHNVKAAFIRNGDLWLKINEEEKQITKGSNIHSPQWSYDGKLLLYEKEVPSTVMQNGIQNELWIYQVKSNEHKKIFYDGVNPLWAPNKNILSFQSGGILNVSDLKQFYNVALGVHGYTWLPDGSGFIAASQAQLRPDGWTKPIIYKIQLQNDYKDVHFFENATPIFTVPNEVGVDKEKIMSITLSDFRFSPSHKWISFIISPTASLAMDRNILSILSSNGEKFKELDEVITYGIGKPQWAPTKDVLAYIAGGGRIVFGFKNKTLTVSDIAPNSKTLTPSKYAELAFTWVDDKTIISSRIHEAEWSNDQQTHPDPSLYAINITENKQANITNPPKDLGDYDPMYIPALHKLVWLRGKSISDKHRDVWIGEPNGKHSEEWIRNVENIEIYGALN